jgi:cytochrome c-type biogenesis protein CcmF
VELGWGGYWGWDPVENASLMPWLTGTAFLHSVMIQEKRRMLKVWNMVLIIASFSLCLFGTFLTRSGAVSSVHAFAQSKIGPVFAVFIAIVLAFSFALLFSKLKYLKSANQLDSVVSRESAFLFNNLVLLAAMFAVLWGTLLPVISEWLQGEKITVGPPFFNKVTIPIGLIVLFLTGVGPLVAWRKNSPGTLRRNFRIPGVAALVTAALLLVFKVWNIYALVSFSLCSFVVATIASEFWRGARARQKSTGESFFAGLVNLTLRNKRRYGCYIVHLALVLIFLGFTGNAFNTDAQ